MIRAAAIVAALAAAAVGAAVLSEHRRELAIAKADNVTRLSDRSVEAAMRRHPAGGGAC